MKPSSIANDINSKFNEGLAFTLRPLYKKHNSESALVSRLSASEYG